jgi:ABC-type multidrug transport system fused ATPase/permease subunit
VAFSFKEKRVLSGLSLTLEGGKTIALVGTSGGGKSTIARLLLQLLKPEAGLDTVVGERGIKLSGGERQRLAFGRVFIQNPKIIILDEPTSALDSLTESFVTHHMTALFKEKTVVIVAHRLQTVKEADKIVVLEAGRVIQEGGFDQLAAKEGKFRQLWEKQTARKEKLRPLQAEVL